MDMSSLRVFKAVAETGSVSRAAQAIHCVQSNVTARVRQLEEELETRLFFRKPRGMALTPSGRILLDYAERAIRLLEEARRAVKEDGRVTGSLTIGSTESAAVVRLPPVLSRFCRSYPEVFINLTTSTSEDLLARVLDYGLEGAFVSGPVGHLELCQDPVFEEELVLVTALERRSIAECQGSCLLLLRSGCNHHARLALWLREIGVLPGRSMEMGTREAILSCVSAGLGVAVFPRSVVTSLKYDQRVRLHKIPTDSARVPVIFVWRRDTRPSRALQALLDMVHLVNEARPAPVGANLTLDSVRPEAGILQI